MAVTNGNKTGHTKAKTWVFEHVDILVFVGIVVTILVAVWGVFGAPRVGPTRVGASTPAEMVSAAEHNVRDTWLKLAAGLGVIFGAIFAWARMELSNREHLLGVSKQETEKFGEAVRMLDSTSSYEVLGGIYLLSWTIEESPSRGPQAIGVLTEFVRRRTQINFQARQ